MKKLVLVILIAVMTATPCLAQEIEPEGMFSIERTRWQRCPTLGVLPIPYVGCEESADSGIGFYQGKVYSSMFGLFNRYMLSFYVDMLGVSTYFAYTCAPPTVTIWETGFIQVTVRPHLDHKQNDGAELLDLLKTVWF